KKTIPADALLKAANIFGKSMDSVTAGSSGCSVAQSHATLSILSVEFLSTDSMILGVGGLVNKAG
ncbi:MAG: hypothetical protein OQK02_07270, partial [Marinobacter sp.]|nr:hypothetical protein [Marinobacter sp.]